MPMVEHLYRMTERMMQDIRSYKNVPDKIITDYLDKVHNSLNIMNCLLSVDMDYLPKPIQKVPIPRLSS